MEWWALLSSFPVCVCAAVAALVSAAMLEADIDIELYVAAVNSVLHSAPLPKLFEWMSTALAITSQPVDDALSDALAAFARGSVDDSVADAAAAAASADGDGDGDASGDRVCATAFPVGHATVGVMLPAPHAPAVWAAHELRKQQLEALIRDILWFEVGEAGLVDVVWQHSKWFADNASEEADGGNLLLDSIPV